MGPGTAAGPVAHSRKMPKIRGFWRVGGGQAAAGATRGLQRGGAKAGTVARQRAAGRVKGPDGVAGAGHPGF